MVRIVDEQFRGAAGGWVRAGQGNSAHAGGD